MRHYAKLGLLASVVALAACTDNSYDLDNVDWKLGTNADLTLPACSSDEILLRNFMDLKAEGVIKLVPGKNGDSIFVVDQTDTIDPQIIDVNKITINKPVVNDFSQTVKLLKTANSTKAKAPRRLPIATPIGDIEVPDSFVYAGEVGRTSFSAKGENVSNDVLNIERVTCAGNTVTVNISASVASTYTYLLDKIHLDNLVIYLPEDLHVSSCTLDDRDAVSIEPGVITLTEPFDPYQHNLSNIVLKLKFDAIKTGSDFTFNYATHTANIAGELKLSGKYRYVTQEFYEDIKNKVIEIAKNPTSDDCQKLIKGDYSPVIPSTITINASTKFADDIVATQFSGDVQHAVNKVNPVKLKDVPEFLNDTNTFIDLVNPMLILSAKSVFPNDAKTSLTFKSNTYNIPLTTNEVTFLGGGKQSMFYFANRQGDADLPEEFSGAKYTAMTDSLGKLINHLPDSISISVAPVTMHCENLTLGNTYQIDVNYKFYAPLQFGPKFYLNYVKTEKGWDLSDASNLETDAIDLSADLSTYNIDSEFLFTVIPVDSAGNNLSDILKVEGAGGLNGVNVPVLKDGSTPIALTVKPMPGHTIHEALAKGPRQLNGIQYRAILSNPCTDPRALTDRSYIKLKNVKMHIKGVVSYDAN